MSDSDIKTLSLKSKIRMCIWTLCRKTCPWDGTLGDWLFDFSVPGYLAGFETASVLGFILSLAAFPPKFDQASVMRMTWLCQLCKSRYALWSSGNWLIFPSYQGFGAWTPNKLGEETRFPVLNSHHEIQSDSFSNQFFPSNNHHFAQEHSPRKWAVLNVAQDGEFGGAPPPRGGPAPAWGAGFTLCTWTVISNIAMDYDGH